MKAYRMLPAARVGMGAQPPLPMMRRVLAGPMAPYMRGMGDSSGVLQLPTITIYGSDVDTKLQAMVSDIATNGCSATVPVPSVSAFQTAFNAQSTPNGGTTLTVDGLYGDNTKAAADSVNTNDQLNLTIPAGCATGASSSGSSSSGSSSPSTSSSNVTVATGSPYTPYLVAGAIVATGLVGYAVWHHETHGAARHPAHAHRVVRHMRWRRR